MDMVTLLPTSMSTSRPPYPPQRPNARLPPDSIPSNRIPHDHVSSCTSELGALTAGHNYLAVTVLAVNGLTGSLQRQALVDRVGLVVWAGGNFCGDAVILCSEAVMMSDLACCIKAFVGVAGDS